MLYTKCNKKKIIALVDCNSFYVSCERLFNPKIKNVPVVVLSNNDGCVISRSTEAKQIGIKMGEPYFKVKHLVKKNNVAVFSSNYALYGDLSRRVMNILKKFSSRIEYYSIDEAFLDLTDMIIENINDYIVEMKKNIYQHTGIPVSIGVASTKTLAKVANLLAKKKDNGVENLTIRSSDEINSILQKIDVRDIWGVGSQLSKLYKKNNINNGYELKIKNTAWIRKNTNIIGLKTVAELNGISCIDFNDGENAPRKSCCVSRSFGKKVETLQELEQSITSHCLNAAEKIRQDQQLVKSVIIFIKTSPFDQSNFISLSKKIDLPIATDDSFVLLDICLKALSEIFIKGRKYQKAGVLFLGLQNKENYQANLFSIKDSEKSGKLMKILDDANLKFGRNFMSVGDVGFRGSWKMRRDYSSRIDTSDFKCLPTVNSG
jgi:DNA polymerase V